MPLHTNLESKMKEEERQRFKKLPILSKMVAGLQLRIMPVENFAFWPNRKIQFSNFKKTHQDLNLFPTLFVTVKTTSACFT